MGTIAYKLKLPDTTKIHETFHVSQLKALYGVTTSPYLPFPLTIEIRPIMMPIILMLTKTMINNGR